MMINNLLPTMVTNHSSLVLNHVSNLSNELRTDIRKCNQCYICESAEGLPNKFTINNIALPIYSIIRAKERRQSQSYILGRKTQQAYDLGEGQLE